jgi:hypothetical protein
MAENCALFENASFQEGLLIICPFKAFAFNKASSTDDGDTHRPTQIRKLTKEAIEKTAKLALLSARLNDKAELLNALEDLKFYTKKHHDELQNVISQVELMLKEGIPIGEDFIERLKVLLHRIEREV